MGTVEKITGLAFPLASEASAYCVQVGAFCTADGGTTI